MASWVNQRFPVVVIDEFQDCRTGRLGIAQGLSAKADLLVAADAFQDLSETGDSPAVEWLSSAAQVENLTTVHRTSDGGLLQTALALRNGTPVANSGNAKFFCCTESERRGILPRARNSLVGRQGSGCDQPDR